MTFPRRLRDSPAACGELSLHFFYFFPVIICLYSCEDLWTLPQPFVVFPRDYFVVFSRRFPCIVAISSIFSLEDCLTFPQPFIISPLKISSFTRKDYRIPAAFCFSRRLFRDFRAKLYLLTQATFLDEFRRTKVLIWAEL